MPTCWLLCGLKKAEACCWFMKSCWCCGVACGCMLAVWAGCGAACGAACAAEACWAGWTAAVAGDGTWIPTPGRQNNQKNEHINIKIRFFKLCTNSCFHPTFKYTNKCWNKCLYLCNCRPLWMLKPLTHDAPIRKIFQKLVIFGPADGLDLISTFIWSQNKGILYNILRLTMNAFI